MASARAKELAKNGFATLAEAQEFLQVKQTFLYKLMRTRVIPYGRFGRHRKIPWNALHEFAANQLDRINNL